MNTLRARIRKPFADRMEMLNRALTVFGAGALVLFFVHWAPPPDYLWCELGTVLPLALLLSLVIAILPEETRWIRLQTLQTAAIVLVFLAARIGAWRRTPLPPWVLAASLGLPLVLSLVSVCLALQRRMVLLGTIVITTAALFFLSWLPVALRSEYNFWCGFLHAPLAFLFVCTVVGSEGRLRWGDSLRALCSQFTAWSPLPAEDVVRTDRSPRCLATGASWLVLGLFLAHFRGWLASRFSTQPLAELTAGRFHYALFGGVHSTLMTLTWVGARLMPVAGMLRMMGVPIRAPLDAPWKSTNLVEYWRRANVYNYLLQSRMYFRPFWPMRGWGMLVGIVTVFWISGYQHAIRAGLAGHWSRRWLIDGTLTAVTAAWLQWRSQSRVRAYVARTTLAEGGSDHAGLGIRCAKKVRDGLFVLIVLGIHGLIAGLE